MQNVGPLKSDAPLSIRATVPWLVLDCVLALLIGAASFLMAGPSLGFVFAPILLATLVAPPLILAEQTLLRRVLAWIFIVAGIWIVWTVLRGISAGEAARCALVLAAYLLALGGLAAALHSIGLPAIPASAITVILGLAWLTWPVWLSPELTGSSAERLVAWLTPAHPLLAMNGVVLARFDAWDRYRIAYQQLTTLNQDVLYHLPRSIVPSVALHGVIGLIALLSSTFRTQKGRSPATPPPDMPSLQLHDSASQSAEIRHDRR